MPPFVPRSGPRVSCSRGLPTFCLLLLGLTGCAQPPANGSFVDDVALADESNTEDWLAYGRTTSEQRFSPLTQIHDGNVAELRPDWVLELDDKTGLASTPLVVDGRMFFIRSMNRVMSVDATSGEVLWEYDPEVGEYAERLRAGWDHSRGIAYWGDKVYVATWDGRLNAIDAQTGREVWSAHTIEADKPMYITGAPKVFKGKVLIGNGGTENGPNRGYVTAYDAETGAQAWRFWIVPGNPADGFEDEAMAMAAETWSGEWWHHGGGGNAWHGVTYDIELDQLYIGTGNGSPWNQKVRSPGGGDNLFLSSIVALDPDTGEYLWHYQTVPGDTWDYNSNMDIVLADLEMDGEDRKVLLHAPKNGFFYVIDRTDGTLISADAFAETTWASHIDLETGRPVEYPDARYEGAMSRITPGPIGAHNWHAMSFNPRTGLAYYPAIHTTRIFEDSNIDVETYRNVDWLLGLGVEGGDDGSSREDGLLSTLQAWDPVRKELAWELPLPGLYNPGTLTTAGNLLFQGRVDGTLVAYRADTGEELWSESLGLGITAPPITYSIDGRQYVALLVGWGGILAGLGGPLQASHGWAYGVHQRMLVAFSLDGEATLPGQPPPEIPVPREADFDVDPVLAAEGEILYSQRCFICHGPGAVAGGLTPDLRASRIVPSLERFAGVVRDGERADDGMPAYVDIDYDQLVRIQHYIRREAETALASASAGGGS